MLEHRVIKGVNFSIGKPMAAILNGHFFNFCYSAINNAKTFLHVKVLFRSDVTAV